MSTAATSIDTSRPGLFPARGDTDAWSVAATIDDQESVLSTNTQKSRQLYFEDPPHETTLYTSSSTGSGLAMPNTTSRPMSGSGLLDDDDNGSQAELRSLTSRSLVAEYGDRTTDGFTSDISLVNEDDDDPLNDEEHHLHFAPDRSPTSSLVTHADPFHNHLFNSSFYQRQQQQQQQRRRSSGGQRPASLNSGVSSPTPQSASYPHVAPPSPSIIQLDANASSSSLPPDSSHTASANKQSQTGPGSPCHDQFSQGKSSNTSSRHLQRHQEDDDDPYQSINVAVDDAIRAPTEPEPSIASLHHRLHQLHPSSSSSSSNSIDMDSHHHHRRHHHHLDMPPTSLDPLDIVLAPPQEPTSGETHRRHHHHHHYQHHRALPHDSSTDQQHYERLLEENAILMEQLQRLELTTKHQQEIIASLQSHHEPLLELSSDRLDSTSLAQQLVQWAELLSIFTRQWTDHLDQQQRVEKDLVQHMLEYFLHVLPFGTDNQVLLNTAYRDQLGRFQKTLGPTFAKWYRQQTVQSLARNPASRDYLQAVRMLITQHVTRVLNVSDPTTLTASTEWQHLLNHCTRLSLELHGGDRDVMIRDVSPGDLYDENTMAVLDDLLLSRSPLLALDATPQPESSTPSHRLLASPSVSPTESLSQTVPASTVTTAGSSSLAEAALPSHPTRLQYVKTMISPIFMDENETVLLPARVTLV
ncbi:hypothetical protein DM01DRAFT_1336643 [Hesseltinella vesiculosa]|uniref:Uncharacterized protein n=1 Tax=Hesseltinella vesiculosa TaxID=101127 RepID=A0A1X2GG51_9FUNG|nr:hypothetical protein DM01DRAFT_1336643 [Hesseltinella vesiculosa]